MVGFRLISISVVVSDSSKSPLRATARAFVEIATIQTVARRKCLDLIARQTTNCGGKDVYFASIVALGGALPLRRSSNG